MPVGSECDWITAKLSTSQESQNLHFDIPSVSKSPPKTKRRPLKIPIQNVEFNRVNRFRSIRSSPHNSQCKQPHMEDTLEQKHIGTHRMEDAHRRP